MGEFAIFSEFALFFVENDEFVGVPKLTGKVGIVEFGGVSSEILKVVGVDAVDSVWSIDFLRCKALIISRTQEPSNRNH